MTQLNEHSSHKRTIIICARIAAICLIAAFISALYYAFQVSVSNGVLYDPIYLWNFSCVALIIGCAFGLFAYWRKSN